MKNPIHLLRRAITTRHLRHALARAVEARKHRGLTVHVVVSSGSNPATQRCGLVTDAIERDHGDLSGWRAYLCGSPPMVEAATVVVRRQGIAAEHIHADAFYTQGT